MQIVKGLPRSMAFRIFSLVILVSLPLNPTESQSHKSPPIQSRSCSGDQVDLRQGISVPRIRCSSATPQRLVVDRAVFESALSSQTLVTLGSDLGEIPPCAVISARFQRRIILPQAETRPFPPQTVKPLDCNQLRKD